MHSWNMISPFIINTVNTNRNHTIHLPLLPVTDDWSDLFPCVFASRDNTWHGEKSKRPVSRSSQTLPALRRGGPKIEKVPFETRVLVFRVKLYLKTIKTQNAEQWAWHRLIASHSPIAASYC